MKKIFIIVLLLISFSKAKVLDRIVAIVGNEVILESSLNQMVLQRGALKSDQTSEEQFRQEVLNDMIASQVLYDIALNDTLVSVENEEILQTVDYQIKNILQKIGGEEVLEEKYNTSVNKLREVYKENVTKSLFVEKLKKNKFKNMQVTHSEVKEFYESHKKDLPLIESSVKLSQIVLKYDSRNEFDQIAYSKLNRLRSQILAKEISFEEAAKEYSDDKSSASAGGLIGFTNRGDLVKEYEASAYNMEEGELSEIVTTSFGYHLIKLLKKRGDQIKTAHILIKPNISKKTEEDLQKMAKMVSDTLKSKKMTFEEAAKLFSDDQKSKYLNGNIGRWYLKDLDQKFKTLFDTLAVGEISAPIKEQDGYYIFKLLDKEKEHQVNFKKDYQKLKDWCLEDKKMLVLDDWVEELRKRVYIEVK